MFLWDWVPQPVIQPATTHARKLRGCIWPASPRLTETWRVRVMALAQSQASRSAKGSSTPHGSMLCLTRDAAAALIYCTAARDHARGWRALRAFGLTASPPCARVAGPRRAAAAAVPTAAAERRFVGSARLAAPGCAGWGCEGGSSSSCDAQNWQVASRALMLSSAPCCGSSALRSPRPSPRPSLRPSPCTGFAAAPFSAGTFMLTELSGGRWLCPVVGSGAAGARPLAAAATCEAPTPGRAPP